MAVLKAKRKASQFEVFHHFYKMRKEVTGLLLNDFGFDLERARKKVMKTYFGGRSYGELSPEEKDRFDRLFEKYIAFENWFVADERQTVMNCLRIIGENIFVANSIYPTCQEELTERRIRQDRAIGQCFRLTQELQYAIETLPVDVNKYLRFTEMIQTEINLLKGWRQSDNKFKKGFEDEQSEIKQLCNSINDLILIVANNRATSDSASNFANVNNNGNANYNNASNANGVRPDFDSAIK